MALSKDDRACLFFALLPFFGPVSFLKFIAFYKNPSAVFSLGLDELKGGCGEKMAEKICQFRERFQLAEYIAKLEKKKIGFLAYTNPKYPPLLKGIADPPIGLFYKGDLANFDFTKEDCFAIVGTRRPTEYGRSAATVFSKDLAEAGLIVVSGMALGVDSLVHWQALKSKQRTIAVLGCGVDIVYPNENHSLYQEIIANKGLIISEFCPGQTVLRGLFVSRNRIISGLCKGVLIIEGTGKSGTLITARYALEQGREVFAVPGQINHPNAQAPNMLIKQGALLVENSEEIMSYLGMQKPVWGVKLGARQDLDELEKQIMEKLEQEAFYDEELVKVLQIPLLPLLEKLSLLELKGMVNKDKQDKWQIKNY